MSPARLNTRVCPHFQIRIRKITPKVVQLLTEWTETFPYDFRDERLMRSLKELTHRLAGGDEVSRHSSYFLLPLVVDTQQKCYSDPELRNKGLSADNLISSGVITAHGVAFCWWHMRQCCAQPDLC